MSTCKTYPSISEKDVICLIDEVIADTRIGNLNSNQEYAVEVFAAELLGVSIDELISKMDELPDIDENPVVSQEDVLDTIDAFQHDDTYDLSEEQMDAIYSAASELTGFSTDKIFELMEE